MSLHLLNKNKIQLREMKGLKRKKKKTEMKKEVK
jgi:hypothetical protein